MRARSADHHGHRQGRGDRRVVGLELGADDYRRQAVRPPRVGGANQGRFASRPGGRHGPRRSSVGALEIDVPARRATLAGRGARPDGEGVRSACAPRLRPRCRRRPAQILRRFGERRGTGRETVDVHVARCVRSSATRARSRRCAASGSASASRRDAATALHYLSLTLVVLARLEVPLGFSTPAIGRTDLEVDQTQCALASLSEGRWRASLRLERPSPRRSRQRLRGGHRRSRGDHRRPACRSSIGTAARGSRSFADRPEFADSAGGRRCHGVRNSSTLGYSSLYVAVPVASAA